MEACVQNDLLKILAKVARQRAVLLREEALLWEVLSGHAGGEAERRNEPFANAPDGEAKPAAPTNEASDSDRKILVGVSEAARIMGIGRSSIYKEINASRLKVRKAGKRTLIAVADIESWCRNLPVRR